METMPPQPPLRELEVKFKPESGKTVIEGMTTVPFSSLVTLILQKKVQVLFKRWSSEPVIVGSDLLTQLASAPQDSRENTGKVIAVALGIGGYVGILASVATFLFLSLTKTPVTTLTLLYVAGALLSLLILGLIVYKFQKPSQSDQIVEMVEKITRMIG